MLTIIHSDPSPSPPITADKGQNSVSEKLPVSPIFVL